jgi:hypothetical protein
VQAPFFEEVVDDAPFGQIGFGDFHRGIAIVRIFCDKVFVELEVFFTSAHVFHSRLQGPFAHLIAANSGRVKKIFSIDQASNY